MSMLKQAYAHFCKETKVLRQAQQKVSVFRSESISDCVEKSGNFMFCGREGAWSALFLTCLFNAVWISV